MNLLNDIIKNPHSMLAVQAGHYDGISAIHKFGANFDVDNGSTPESVWSGGGLYPWPTTAQTVIVTGSDTGDVAIQGLDASYHVITETVAVGSTSTKSFLRVYRASFSDTTANTADILLKHGSTTIAKIDAEKGQTLMAVYTVPAGHTAFMLVFDASIQKGRDAQLRLMNGDRVAHVCEIYESQYRYDFTVPIMLPEKTDIDVQVVEVETSNTRVTANFDLLLVRNDG